MFKKATKKLATITIITGNSRIRPLKELVAAEELVLHSLQGLRTGFDKTFEALKAWTSDKDEDLENTLSTCSKLLNHWISSFESFSTPIGSIRKCLEDYHAAEESLRDLRRHRHQVTSHYRRARRYHTKVDSYADRIRAINAEIKNKETSLDDDDLKRTVAREWVDDLFGGLLDCSEQCTVIATLGHAIFGNSSTYAIQPDLPQAHYSGQSQVESLEEDPERDLGGISSVGGIGDKAEQLSGENCTGSSPGHLPPHATPLAQPTTAPLPQPYISPTPSNNTSTSLPTQLPPTDSARSRLLRPSQGSSGFTPDHELQLSQSSTPSDEELANILGEGEEGGEPALVARVLATNLAIDGREKDLNLRVDSSPGGTTRTKDE